MNDSSTTGYCLACPGKQYLVYQPASGELKLKLKKGTYRAEWFDPNSGKAVSKQRVSATDEETAFANPLDGEAILFVYASK
jgi:hypothetical protein